MEKILKEILSELKEIKGHLATQTRMFADMIIRKDDVRYKNDEINIRMRKVAEGITKMPGMDTPQAEAIIEQIMGIFGGLK